MRICNVAVGPGEIGANTCIDKWAIRYMVLGDGTKLDDRVHVATRDMFRNNTPIGKNTRVWWAPR